jgi:hypothetical protein
MRWNNPQETHCQTCLVKIILTDKNTHPMLSRQKGSFYQADYRTKSIIYLLGTVRGEYVDINRYKCYGTHDIKQLIILGDNHNVGIKEGVLSDVSVRYGFGNEISSLD